MPNTGKESIATIGSTVQISTLKKMSEKDKKDLIEGLGKRQEDDQVVALREQLERTNLMVKALKQSNKFLSKEQHEAADRAGDPASDLAAANAAVAEVAVNSPTKNNKAPASSKKGNAKKKAEKSKTDTHKQAALVVSFFAI